MDDLRFCPQCGKLHNTDYRFCPFCGVPQKSAQDWDSLLDECLAPLEKQERSLLLDRLLELDSKIHSLDREIQGFLEKKLPAGVR